MDDISIFLGNRIRELRKDKGMSQEELAFKSNINPAHLGQIERALKSPTLDTINKIALGLNIQLYELFQSYSPCTSTSTPENLIISKINYYLISMKPAQQKAILHLIKSFIEFGEHFS